MNDHIGKPLDPDRLVATLAKWVRPNRTTASSLPPPAVTTSVPVPLPDLPGVKVKESVRRIGGNVALYYSLLDKFRVNQRNVVQLIRDALVSNDPKTAERLAHTLRGIAGNLGAESLQNQAEFLERNIKNGALDDVESLLAQTDREIVDLIARIDQAIEARLN
jgi:HPt (histidine-containing phosphotransfer) domain-containing protein